MTVAAARAAIDAGEVEELLSELVAAPSPNPPGDVEAVVERIVERLAIAGIPHELDVVAPGRPNLHAQLGPPGRRPRPQRPHRHDAARGRVAVDLFVPDVADGVMRGLGACDMKGGLAAIVVAALALDRCGVVLRRGVRLDLVVDEESTGAGSIRAAASRPLPDGAIVVEPTSLELVHVGHGQVNVAYELRGVAAHGSRPDLGANAVAAASCAIVALEDWHRRRVPATHQLVGPESISIGTIAGGAKTSVVPDWCRFSVVCRVAPGRDPDAAAAELDGVVAAALAGRPGVSWTREVEIRVLPFETSPETSLPEALRGAHAEVCGQPCRLAGMRATTDAAAYAAHGVPVVIYGAGDLADAHRANERVVLAEVVTAARVLLATMLSVAT